MPQDHDAPTAAFKLKGIPAVIAVIVFFAAAVVSQMFLKKDVSSNPTLRNLIEQQLMSEIAGDITAGSQAIQDALDRGDKATAAKLAEQIQQRKVEVKELAMRGSGKDIIIRANYSVHGPNGSEDKTGYYKFSYQTIGGWRYRHESTAVSWYMKLF